ncbi:zinc finger CCCH domain-containing protein 5-like, partial [Citrus sinensis]|uniref:zinc finger CCCH domain-containing protein 5-like n=1 Tax=Citrus sinensis TaxID=2711 RepID=UPI002277F732
IRRKYKMEKELQKIELKNEFKDPRWQEEGKTEHNGAGQHDKCSHVSNRCHPSPRTECHLATYPSLAHQLRRVLGASQIWRRKENECDEDDDWEYVEEWPAEIIWQGNEIIMRKKKVRVPKKDANPLSKKEVILQDVDRPTSNPLPPQSETFADHQNAQQALETVAQQVPNFGTEQDKAHCPFHLKTGACRFGQRCSRVHFYPNKACTLLIKNMYNGPGLAWEQDEGLEYTDEEVERSYEEFYEDVHTEFLKFGEIVNFKFVCRNGSSHLRGSVYVHYKSLESAILAYHSVNGCYFTGKQITCEFINVTRWKIAICGEYMKSRLKTCSRGMACNFIHCFRNPSGDYEWADWDKPPPRYWVKKMAALFGYSDESGTWNQERSGKRGTR